MTKRHHFSLCGIFMCLLGFAARAQAEDQPFSADSLIATFKRGSNVSVKGTAITLSGVVAEVKKSIVVFKSSDNDKVICESAAPIAGATVGQPLTVNGKVRGRGLLGNVTLDSCGPVSKTLVADKPPEPVAPISEIPIRSIPTVEIPPVQPASTPAPNTSPAVVTKPSASRKAAPHAVANSAAVDDALPQRPEIPELDIPELEPPTPAVTQEKPVVAVRHRPQSPYQTQFPIWPIIVGIGTLVGAVKVAPLLASGFRKPPKVESVADQVRRKALEELLAADKLKK